MHTRWLSRGIYLLFATALLATVAAPELGAAPVTHVATNNPGPNAVVFP